MRYFVRIFLSCSTNSGGDELPLRQLKILIVDDDPDATAMLHIILGDRGATLRANSDVAQALAMVASFKPDVLISDIGMVSHDGCELIRELRRRESQQGMDSSAGQCLPAIALTSFARDSDRLQAITAGIDPHCPKPLRP
ncbi:MAG: response regulator [Massilia sp.]|nr:response regulator [Aquabacterium sp.]